MYDDKNIQYDINLVNVCKSYGNKNIINGLNMSVSSGSIYGLLGGSGCGKSTLLHCILGKTEFDSGDLYLRADSFNDIGYMPQDLCLETELTIKELFQYYGSLYKMTKYEIEFRSEDLTKLLQLPDTNKYIQNLSGGQCRRVSLAISILHNPKICILDEPTVGIDPLLRKKIWDEFSRLVEQDKKTIIITTHYIEEATKANRIGFMRNGVLVDEGEPQKILTKYETDSLEKAFLKICSNQEKYKVINVQEIHTRKKVNIQNQHFPNNSKPVSFHRMKALIKKNFNMLLRNYLLLWIMLVIPIIQAFALCFGIGTNIKDLQLAVRSEEVKLSDCYNFKINECILVEVKNQTLSCVVLNYLLSLDYKLVEVKDKDEGENMINNYNTLAFLYFSHNYTNDLMFYVGDNRDMYDLSSPVYLHYAKDNILLKNQILKDVKDSIGHVIEKTLDSCSYNRRSLSLPIEIDVILGKEVKSLLNGGVAFFVSIAGNFLSATFGVTFMDSECTYGLLSRSMLAGVKIIELLISLFCIFNVVYILQTIPSLYIVYVLFSNPIIVNGTIILFFFILILLGWIGFLVGVLIVGIFPSNIGSVYILNGMFMANVLLSGFLWPLDGQIFWLKSLSKIMPTTLAGNTLNNIALRGWTWEHPSVVYNTAMLTMHLVLLILVLFVLKIVKKDMWILKK